MDPSGRSEAGWGPKGLPSSRAAAPATPGASSRARSDRTRGVIVAGGTGALGRAVVATLLGRGVRVAVPYRSREEWNALRDAHGKDAPLLGATPTLADPEATRAFVDQAAGFLGVLDGSPSRPGPGAGKDPRAAPAEIGTA